MDLKITSLLGFVTQFLKFSLTYIYNEIYHSVDKTGDDSEDEIEEGDPLVLLLSLDSLKNWNPGMELKAKLSVHF